MTLPGLLVLQPVAVVLAALAAVHARGRRHLAGLDPHRAQEERREGRLFLLGTGLAAAVLCSPLERFAVDNVFAGALVEVTLAFVAAPLVVLGAPWRALAAGLGRRLGGRDAGEPWTREGGRAGASDALPLLALASYLAAIWVFHVPAVLDATVHSLALRSVELAWFLVAGVLLSSQLVGSHPYRPAWQPLGRVALVAAILAGSMVLAAPMAFSSANWYPALATGPTAVVSAVNRQAIAGAVLWALPAIPLGAATFWCFTEWLRRDEDDEWRLRALMERSTAPADALWREARER